MTETTSNDARWPDVDVAGWAPTKHTLHRVLQMLGKVRVALSPVQPNWMHTALLVTPRGLTTGLVPCSGGAFAVTLDVFDSRLAVERSDGEQRTIALLPMRTVAGVYAGLGAAFDALGIDCAISSVPQEVPDVTPLGDDHRAAAYDPAAVVRWFAAITSAATLFDRWRKHFFGRTGIQLWWGALDVALLLFSGKHATPPAERGYLLKYDLDAEMMNVGLYFGDERTAPFFYGYIFPQPAGARSLPIAPADATWSADLAEWVLPYDRVRTAADPDAAVTAFLDAIYEHCVTVGSWDRAALSYVAPRVPAR